MLTHIILSIAVMIALIIHDYKLDGKMVIFKAHWFKYACILVLGYFFPYLLKWNVFQLIVAAFALYGGGIFFRQVSTWVAGKLGIKNLPASAK